jgi:hypothetical protein
MREDEDQLKEPDKHENVGIEAWPITDLFKPRKVLTRMAIVLLQVRNDSDCSSRFLTSSATHVAMYDLWSLFTGCELVQG